MTWNRHALVPLSALLAVGAVAGCSGSAGGPTGPSVTTVAVESTDSACTVASAKLAAGRHTFEVSNTSSQITEMYVYGAGDRIMGEVENIGPSTKRTLIVDLPAGDYQVACKPGMVGNGIRTALQVTGTATAAAPVDRQLATAVAGYRRFVETETVALVDATAAFTSAVDRGDLRAARAAYPTARLHYERIEPIAESFGELDPLIDMRADDAVDGVSFVGFHALERLLFARRTLSGATALTGPLRTNVAKLAALVKTVDITPLTMANGAKSLLDEVAKSKVTGEEERYSRVDLLDFSGNVDGARYVFSELRPVLVTRDAALAATLDRAFAALVTLLETHRASAGSPGSVPGSPFASYDALSPAQVKALAVAVDDVSEPLGRMSAVVTG